jgi:DUF218 domain
MTPGSEPADVAAITSYVDAGTAGLGHADFVIVFGTRFREPAPAAASIYHAGLSPVVVVTGGSNRQEPSLIEADVHAGLLKAAGVPAEAIIVERRSTNTFENVIFARTLLRHVVGVPKTAVAVVKWHHRRAVLLLARSVPSLCRIFTVTYDPPDPATGRLVTRDTWPELDASRIRREYTVIRSLLDERKVDDLAASGHGWMRK